MRYGSVCSGIESASVAVHPLGWEAAWFAENDKACSRLLAKRFPIVTNYGDMTLLPEMVRRGDIEAPDVLVGGTPCQDFSVAGMRRGLKGARGQLTMTYVELADAIDEQRPGDECVVWWENVPGVLNHKDNPFGNFLAALVGEDVPLVPAGKRWTDAGVVFGPRRAVAWRCLDAQYFGLAQRRKRVFVVASARAGFDPAAVLLEREGVRRDTAPRREAGEGVTHAVAPCLTSGRGGAEDPRGQNAVVATGVWPAEIASTLNAHYGDKWGLEDQHVNQNCPLHVPAVREGWICPSCGESNDAVWYPTCEWCDYRIESLAFTAKDHGQDVGHDVAPTLRAMQGARSNGGGQIAVCVTGDVTHTLKAEGFDASEDGTGRGQPIVSVNRDGTQPLYYQHDWAHGRVYGIDGVAPAVTTGNEADGKNILAPVGFQSSQSGVRVQPVAGTLDSNYGSRRHNGVLYPTMAVRRLMPVECERLQGFPDGWTEGQADGPRYKQLGNSKAVPVVRWIGRRIEAEMRRGFVARLQELSRAFD